MRTLFLVLAIVTLALLFLTPRAQAGDCFAGASVGVRVDPFFGLRADPFFTPRVRVDPFFGLRARNDLLRVRDPFFGLRGGPVVIQEQRGLFGLRRTTTVIGR